jgi:HPt (histidine-containing phosphotransfer) domain-containing protein
VDTTPPVNLDNLKANSMGDADFEREMIAMFVTQGKTQIDELRPICINGPSEPWVEISHALKGTAGSVGADKMREMCATSQKMEDASAEDRERILSRIEEQYKIIVAYLIKEGLYKPEA